MAPSVTPAAPAPAPAAKAQKEQKQASQAASEADGGDDSGSIAGSAGSENGNGGGRKRKRNRGGRKRKGAAALANGTAKPDGPDQRDEEEEAAAVVAASKRPRIDMEDLSKSLAITGSFAPSPLSRPRPHTSISSSEFYLEQGADTPLPAAGNAKKPDPEADAKRLEKMCGAMRTILECIGEDPTRPGLMDSPSRYAKALLFLTKGYQQTPREIINQAIWDDEGHNHHGMVIVRDIEIYSLCEHHLVPFTGKVSKPSTLSQTPPRPCLLVCVPR